MRRREFIAGLGGVAAWPAVARAQQSDRMRLLGYFRGASEAIDRDRLNALVGKLNQLGWIEGRNLRIEKRYAAGNTGPMHELAKELVSLRPDVIQASPSPVVAALLAETNTIPIVFTVVADPVEVGFVASLARPGGNVTGFTLLRTWDQQQVAWAAQGDRAERNPGRDIAQPRGVRDEGLYRSNRSGRPQSCCCHENSCGQQRGRHRCCHRRPW